MGKYGVFVGRINPLHLGHEAVCREMLGRFGAEKSLMVLGSSEAPFSLRNFFSYEERRGFVEKVFPGLKITGLPDYPTDEEWLVALDNLLSENGFNPLEVVFFGGSREDIAFFLDAGRKCQIINRFDGTTPRISATEIREQLVRGLSVEEMLNPLIAVQVKELFSKKRKNLRID